MQRYDTPGTDEVDFRRVSTTLRRHLVPILGTSILAGAAAYGYAAQQPPVYVTAASVMTDLNASGATNLATTVAQAQPLPPGAVAQAVRSPGVIASIIRRVEASSLTDDVKRAVVTAVQNDVRNGTYKRLFVTTEENVRQTGQVYQLWARVNDAEGARVLANAAMGAVLDWDVQRTRRRYAQARVSLERQLSALDARVARARQYEAPVTDEERQFAAARQISLEAITQLAVLERSASGTLSIVSDPITPSKPTEPKPVRSGALASVVALILSAGASLLLSLWRRRVYGDFDLPRGIAPLLGRLPRLTPGTLRRGIVTAAQSAPLEENLGFLRVNILAQLPERGTRRLVVSSARAGEGKSAVTAGLAVSLAADGHRVLVVDADPTHGQQELWRRSSVQRGTPATTPTSQLGRVTGDTVTLQSVSDHVDLLSVPANTRVGRGLRGEIEATLGRVAPNYDIILVDAPPMLEAADSVAYASNADGVLLVVGAGGTTVQDVEQAAEHARTAHARLLGFVLNKLPRASAVNTLVPAPAQRASQARVSSEALTS